MVIKKLFRPIYVPLIEKIRWKRECNKYPLKIMPSLQTIRYVKKNGCSIARYGDGEFHLLMEKADIGFQSSSEELANKLNNILIEKNEKLLICVPKSLNSVKGMKKWAGKYWISWGLLNNHYCRVAEKLLEVGYGKQRLGDAMVTRPYMDWKKRKHAKKIFKEFKSIWHEKDILIVEGDQTRLGIGNDLFENVNSIRRILAPSVNAFNSYEQILQSVLHYYNNDLVIIALGPTATVLASDLSKKGIQALDVGHIDIEYMWYKMRAIEKVAIEGKYTNEAVNGKNYSECMETEYLAQVVCRIN